MLGCAVVQELRLLDRDYFKFLLRLAKDAAEDPFRPPSNMRRTEPSPPPAGPSSGDSREASPVLTRRESDTDQAAERLVNLAGQFLLRVRSSLLDTWARTIRNSFCGLQCPPSYL